MKIHLLDMGDERYGDCIVCVGGGKTLMIDGGHMGDIRQRGDAPSIPDQLAQILGPKPFTPDLLIVTHCHSDHIGCLPEMVASGMLKPRSALVADPDIGFGGGDGSGSSDSADPSVERLVAALREEPHSDAMTDNEVAEFIQDAATLESRYRGMLTTLERGTTQLVRYQGPHDGAQLEQALRGLGLRILGPTAEHLKICGDAIAHFVEAAANNVRTRRASDAAMDEVTLYRALSNPQGDGQDMAGRGAALNDQSIVVTVSEGGQSALLTGDMQFAMPEQPGVDDVMRALRKTVVAAGPYAMVKLAHHGSYNGTDQSTIDAFGAQVMTISGGLYDPSHPDPKTLDLLANQSGIDWTRTDRNGLITCNLDAEGAALTISKGRFNDTTRNVSKSAGQRGEGGGDSAEVAQASVARSSRAVTEDGQFIDVTARVPHVATRVTLTIDVAPSGDALPATAAPSLGSSSAVSGGGASPATTPSGSMSRGPRRAVLLPRTSDASTYKMKATNRRLLFVTALQQLARNIGRDETRLAVAAIQDAKHDLLDVSTPDTPYPEVAAKLAASKYDGVVILGGYDVLPSSRMDVLDPTLRAQLRPEDINSDEDRFIVWSDQLYGDADGDQIAELPVSRIPDAMSASLVRAALSGIPATIGTPFGLRNVARPYADTVYQGVPNAAGSPLCSYPQEASQFNPAKVSGSAFYLMLHGSYLDASRFWGEEQGGSALLEAFTTSNVPGQNGGVVLAGCCWGALTVRTPAVRYQKGAPIQTLTVAQSVALTFLSAGVSAFVGCTGTHYSVRPPETAPAYFGGPMHVAFWKAIAAGDPPALALFNAKLAYAAAMPHGRSTAIGVAAEAKTLRQFTCLGLGW
jgi:beta-lactamase superfamily II metal-dependent hydrolase